jgi:hypothetical protein
MGAMAATEQAVDVGGWWRSSRFARTERERGRGSWAEGANERGEMGEQGAGARTWPENARSWARPRRVIVGERLETANRWGRWDRESGAGARERTSADRSSPRDREREREREREGERRDRIGADRRDPPIRQRGRAGERALGLG